MTIDHADIKMTMRYAYPTPENKRKAVDVLEKALGVKNQSEKEFSKREDNKESYVDNSLFSSHKN